MFIVFIVLGHFYDTLLEVDETIGVIMNAIRANKVDTNTLVFVTGDNGPWEMKCELSGSSGPFTGMGVPSTTLIGS